MSDENDNEIEYDAVFRDGEWHVEVEGLGSFTADTLEDARAEVEALAEKAGRLDDDTSFLWGAETTPELSDAISRAIESDQAADAAIERAFDDGSAAAKGLQDHGLGVDDIADLLGVDPETAQMYLADESDDDE